MEKSLVSDNIWRRKSKYAWSAWCATFYRSLRLLTVKKTKRQRNNEASKKNKAKKGDFEASRSLNEAHRQIWLSIRNTSQLWRNNGRWINHVESSCCWDRNSIAEKNHVVELKNKPIVLQHGLWKQEKGRVKKKSLIGSDDDV
jgi:hypothetical protein